MGKSNMKTKNSKKVGTNSGNINNINSGAALVTEEQQDKQEDMNIERTEEELESFENEKDMSSPEHTADDDEEEDDEGDEEWDLKKILSIDAIKHTCPIKCSHDKCTLVAATVWVSNQKPTENWYSCLDCQVM
jgi:hypothetical protein